jgi:hypothetical protein
MTARAIADDDKPERTNTCRKDHGTKQYQNYQPFHNSSF